MKPQILYLTNLDNSNPEEDKFLSDYLKQKFDVTIAHPKDYKSNLQGKDLVVIRNIWPTHEYPQIVKEMLLDFKKRKIKTYNPLIAKGDMKGKSYLIELTKSSYPVIPTISNIKDINLLPTSDKFFVKPIDGEESIGIKIITQEQLKSENLKNMIIQPFIDFKEEVSFYFINNKFQYACYTPDKKQRWEMQIFQPTQEEINFAQKFIDWNALPYGIQRIDALRTQNGKLLLSEVEDFCPFLSLLNIPEKSRMSFAEKFVEDLKFALNSNP